MRETLGFMKRPSSNLETQRTQAKRAKKYAGLSLSMLLFSLLSLDVILKCPLWCASDVRRKLRLYSAYINAAANVADAVG